jgi:hypothetical protein
MIYIKLLVTAIAPHLTIQGMEGGGGGEDWRFKTFR